MKKVFLFICLAGAAIVFSCSDAQDNLYSPSTVAENMTLVTIAMGTHEEVAANPSVIDRVLRFFGARAEADSTTPPAFFTAATLRVTGLDFGVVEHNFVGTPLASVSVTVPAGNYRLFELIAYASPTDKTAIASFRGSTITNLEGGASVLLPLPMTLYEAKIVIPDYDATTSGRMIMINDMLGLNWNESNAFAAVDYYYDVDFDAGGRMFIANNNGTALYLFRIESLDDTSVTSLTITPSISSVAVDKTRNLVYYSNGSNIYRNNLDGTSQTTLSGHGITGGIRGMSVDEETGNLYIAYNTSVQSYNPFTQATVNTLTLAYAFYDVVVKRPYVYIAQNGGFPNNMVLRYNMSLSTAMGALSGRPGGGDLFRGPRRFLAKCNRKITLIDEGGTGTDERIVSFDSIDGAGWQTFMAEQVGKTHMRFYNVC